MERAADDAPLVLVHVPALIKNGIAFERELARSKHPGAELPALAERDRRIGCDEPDPGALADRAAARLEVAALTIVEPA